MSSHVDETLLELCYTNIRNLPQGEAAGKQAGLSDKHLYFRRSIIVLRYNDKYIVLGDIFYGKRSCMWDDG
jgi:hypothetical protein